jgi:hypothetical protein
MGCYVVRIDLKLRAYTTAIGSIALAIDSITATVLVITFPGHHKAAIAYCSYSRILLMRDSVAVDLKFRTRAAACGVIALTVDTLVSTTFFPPALPGHYKATVAETSYGGVQLSRDCVCIGPKFRARTAARSVVALAVDAGRITILALAHPRRYKAPVAERSYGDQILVGYRIGIDLKFRAYTTTISGIKLAVNIRDTTG